MLTLHGLIVVYCREPASRSVSRSCAGFINKESYREPLTLTRQTENCAGEVILELNMRAGARIQNETKIQQNIITIS